jgi:hypothetical protein
MKLVETTKENGRSAEMVQITKTILMNEEH